MTLEFNHEQASLAALERALAIVPGYSSWQRYDPGPRVPMAQRFSALPVLTKHMLREQFPLGFVPTDHDLAAGLERGEVEYAQTSGSTEDRLTVVFHVPWWEASERAAWQLNAHARRVTTGSHREAVLASPRCVGPGYMGRRWPQRAETRDAQVCRVFVCCSESIRREASDPRPSQSVRNAAPA